MMVTYESLYITVNEKGVSTYKMINWLDISRNLLVRLKYNKPASPIMPNDVYTY